MIANDSGTIPHQITKAKTVPAGARRSVPSAGRWISSLTRPKVHGGERLFAILCALLMAAGLPAQTARVAGEVTSFGSTLTNAAAIALDASRNAYVVTTGSGSAVYKESFNSSTGVYTESQLFTVSVGTNPTIAVDSTGANIYIATGSSKTVVQYAGSGTSYSLSKTFSGFGGMTAAVVDSSKNVYIADASSGDLYKETFSAGAYSQATVATGLGAVNKLTIDASGNLFASTTASLFYEIAGSGTTYTKTLLTVPGFTGLTVTGLDADASDDLFIATSGSDVWESMPSGTATYSTSPYYQYTASGVVLDGLGDVYLVSATQPVGTLLTVGSGYLNFGSVGPGTPPTMTIAFTLTSATTTTLDTPKVVTQGLQNYDFTLGTGSTCTGLSISQGNSCTVVVQFSPQASGSRLGAVNLIDGAQTIASSYLGGVGFAPLAVYQSVTLLNTIACPNTCGSSLPNGLSNGRGITVDPAGNVWVANSTAAQILKFPAGSQTPVTFATSSSCQPVGTAIDGEGNVFFTCNGETNMYELVGGAGTPQQIPVGYSTDDHLSVDAAGNLYPTSYQPGNYFLKVAAGTHAVSVIASAPSSARFVGAVTDAAGNTFAPDYTNNILYELPAGSNTLTTLYSGAPLSLPHAIAEDAAGSLYVTTTTGPSGQGTSPLLRFAAGNYTATPASLSVPGGDSLYITPDGDFYTVYTNTTLAVYTRSIFSLTYPSTAVGQTSASQTVTLENDGTAPLTIAAPSSGTNPSVSLNFSYDGSSTCPELSSTSSAITLGAGSSCTQIVEFTPTQAGSISGSLVTRDNSANVAGSKQTIQVSGTAVQGTPTVSVSNVSGTLGQNATLKATVSGGGVAPTGAVSFVVGSGPAVAGTCSGGTASETCTATYPTSSGLVAGSNTITASVVADANYLASSGTGTLTLAPALTTSAVISSLNPSTYGVPVTFKATVASGYGTPTGSVQFLDGTTVLATVQLASGQATYTTSTLLGGSHPITVSYGGSTSFATSTSSPALTQVVNTVAPTVSVPNVQGTLGQNATLTATVTGAGVAPAGAVSFVVGSGASVPATCTAATSSETCTAPYPTNTGVVVGANTITASVAADTNYKAASGTGTLTLAPAVTTSAVSSSLNASTYDSPVTFTAAVTSGYGTPTGSVSFYDGTTLLTTVALTNGSASYTTSTLPGGSHSITVQYGGATNFATSTSSPALTQVVNPVAPTVSVTNVAGTLGQNATLTATVTGGGVAPTGAVSFVVGSGASVPATCAAGTHSETCTASYPTNTGVTAGANAITASYTADANYSAATGTGTLTMAGATTTSSVASSTNPSIYGNPVTFTATVASGYGTPTGSVQFLDGATVLNTVQLASGQATYTTSSLLAGSHPITVAFVGSPSFAASTSSPALSQVVNKVAPAVSVANVSGTLGQNATLTATVTGAGVAPKGAVSFVVGSGASVPATCTAGTTYETCTASYPTGTGVAVGANTITASYATDANYAAATGTGTLTLSGAATTSSVMSSSNPSVYGSPVTFTATVASGYGTPTGSVTFYDGTTALNTVALSGGSASYTTSALLGGNHSITVQYGGGTSFAASTSSPALVQVVNAVAPTVSVANVSGTLGQNAMLSATVTGGGVAPTGAVSFVVGSGALVPATCTAGTNSETCTASYPTNTGLAAGANTITASVAADANYGAGSGTGTLTMSSAATTSSVVSTLNPSTYGTSVTFIATILSGYGTPTGSVQFLDGATVLATMTLSGGKASYTTSTLTGGTHSITVAYSGPSSFSASTSSPALAQVVNVAAATNGDTATGTGTFGAPSTSVSVRIPYAGQAAPTGAITLTDGYKNSVTIQASTCTAAAGVLNCTATLPTASEPAGSNAITVSEAADSNYAGSTGGGYVTLNKAAGGNDTATGTGTYGAPTSAVTVTIPYTGTVAPAGAITVTDTHGNTVSTAASFCSASGTALTCTVNLPTANEPFGPNGVTVSQAADTNYTGSTGSGTVTIGKAPVTSNDTVNGTGTYAAATTPVVITIPYAGTVAPSGAITVADGFSNTVTVAASACSAVNGVLTCTANLPTANEPTGGNPATVSQAADANYSGSTGAGTVTINPAGARGDDSVTGSGSFGAPATPITVLIPYSGSAPTGAISVADTLGNAITIVPSTCQATGSALVCSSSLPTANELVGTNPATVAQAADANHSASMGSGAITINKAAATTTDTATGAGTFGSATTAVTVTIPYPAATAPTGLVSVTDGLGNTVSVPASACTAANQTLTCVAALPTANEPIGSNAVTVAQAADSNYNGSTGSGTVAIAMSTVSPVSSTSGGVQNVTINQGTASTLLTATLSFSGATPPMGAVTFTVANGASMPATCTVGSTQEICTATYPTASLAVGTYTITASEAADANYVAGSATGVLTVAAGSVSPILDNVSDVSNVLITAGTATATLSASITFNGPVPTGGLTFNLPGGNPVAATCTAGPSPLTCTAAYPTASLGVGTYIITATEAADSTYPQGEATALLTVQANAGTPTSPILTTGSNVSSVLVPYGTASATLTANIQYSGPVPTGAVSFTVSDGSGITAPATCVQGTSSLTCTATWSTGSLGIGSYRIEVDEAADANYPAGRAIGTLTVTQVAAGTNDTVSGTGTYGSATTAITVTIPYAGATAPSGDVTVTDNFSNTVTLPASGCTANGGVLTCTGNLSTANVPVGSDPATVGQAADSVYAASTGSGTITINKTAATTGDTVTATGTYGAVTTPVTVTIPYAGVVAPTGAVTVTDSLGNTVTVGGSSCSAASGTLTCTANLPTANEPVGSNTVTVSQAGDANYSGSTGTGTVTIGKAGSTNNDTASGTSTYGAATTAVTITIPYAGTLAPTGAVSVTDGFGNTATVPGTSCTAAGGTLTCLATLNTANEPLGNNPVAVTQIGDPNYAGSTGTGFVTINKAVAGTDSASGTGAYGAAMTPITVTIPYSGATAPTGAITVADTHGNTVTVSSCTATASVLNCTANLPTANEPVGANAVTVSQTADASHSASNGMGTVTINKAPMTSTDTATGTGTYGGATSQVTVTIPYAGPAAPTGAVTITDSQGNTVSVPASSCTSAAGVLTCTANLPTANVAAGTDSLTVTQAGDSNYSGSTGTGSLTISKASGGADGATGTGSYGAATTPVTVTIPYTGATAPTGAITLADSHGNTVTVSGCTAAGNVLTCSATLPTANEPVGANPVTVSQAADASHSASTGAGVVTINKAPLTGTDTATGTGIYGAATTQVTVTIPYAGTAAPTGAVTIADSLGNTITVPASGCAAAAGVLTCTANLPTANEPVGANAVTVTQAGDSNYTGSTGTGTVTIGKAVAGNDTVTGTGTYGSATTAVTVSIPYSGTTPPGGAITISDAHGDTVTVQASSCTAAKGVLTCLANLSTANDPAGSNTVTVTQAADANSNGSSGTGAVTINKAAATTGDTATGSGKYGAATTAVTVSIPYTGAAAPTGAITVTDTLGNTVTVQASSCTAASGVLSCLANLPTANVPVGTDTLAVTQAADANYSGSTGSGSATIAKTTPALSAPTVTPMNGAFGTPVTITQTVPSGETGTVTFSSGTTVLGTGTIANGVATLTTTALPQGADSITATANGDGNFGAATSPAVTDNVGGVTVAVALTSSQSTTTLGSAVTFTAAVTATPSSTVAGTVTFYDGTTVLGTATVSNGTATLSTSSLSAGNHTITASFAPATSSALSSALSAAVIEVVQAAVSTIALTSSLNPAIVQQAVTFAATVPATGGVAPTGMVTFYDGTTVLGTVQLNGSGVANYTTSAMTGGSHTITATYAGDANYAPVTSAAVAQKVSDFGVGNTTPTMAADPGAAAAFNITISPVNGVAFSAPVVLTVTGLPANATAGFSSGTVTPGSAGTTSTMTIQSAAQALTAMERHQHVKSLEAAAAWACLLPLLGLRPVRRRLPKALLMLALFVGSFGVIAPLTGCGGGYFGPQPATYTLTVTGTSGTLQRSTTVTLNIR